MDKRLIWLAVGAFAASTMAFVFAGLLPLVAAANHVSISEAGHLVTAYSLAYAIGTPILATLTGGLDRKSVVVGALMLFLAGNIAAATSSSFAVLTIAQIAMGAAAGLYASTAQAAAIMITGVEHRAKAVAAVVGGTTFAVALGAPIGSLLGNLAGWRATFLFVGAVGALCALVLVLMLPRGLAGVKLSLAERVLTIGRPGIAPSLLVTLLYLTGGFVVISYLGPIATEGAGLPLNVLPAILLAFGIGAVIGNYLSGRLTDRIGASRVVTFSLLACASLCILISLALRLLPSSIAGPLLIVAMVPWGVVAWLFPPAQASRIVAAAPEVANLTLPLNMSSMYFGIAAGTLLGGQLLKVMPAAELGLVAAAFPLVALPILLAQVRQKAGLAEEAMSPGE
jgi:MFS transporter, DHA1 family, inner membrane transport protein